MIRKCKIHGYSQNEWKRKLMSWKYFSVLNSDFIWTFSKKKDKWLWKAKLELPKVLTIKSFFSQCVTKTYKTNDFQQERYKTFP